MLSQEQLDHFEREGYLVVENLNGGKEVLDVRSKRLAMVSDAFVYAAL